MQILYALGFQFRQREEEMAHNPHYIQVRALDHNFDHLLCSLSESQYGQRILYKIENISTGLQHGKIAHIRGLE